MLSQHIERRRITDYDAKIVAGVGNAGVKVGVLALALLSGGPEALTATAVGMLVAGELTGVVLEAQRERLIGFVHRFATRAAELPEEAQERLRAQLQTEEGSRIFEVAWYQAAQEVDPEKLDYIAALLKNSLSSEQLREHQTRHLLKLLGELDAVQIIILQSFSLEGGERATYKEQHCAIFENEEHPIKPQFIPSREYSRFVRYWVPQTEEEKAIAQKDRADYKAELDSYNARFPQLQEEYEVARERHALFASRVHILVEKGLLGVERKREFFKGPIAVSEALTPLGAALLKVTDVTMCAKWGSGYQVSAVEVSRQSVFDSELAAQEAYETMLDVLEGR